MAIYTQTINGSGSANYTSAQYQTFVQNVKALFDQLVTAGLLVSATPCQGLTAINPATVNNPGAGTVAGYLQYNFTDSLQSTAPVGILLTFGSSTNNYIWSGTSQPSSSNYYPPTVGIQIVTNPGASGTTTYGPTWLRAAGGFFIPGQKTATFAVSANDSGTQFTFLWGDFDSSSLSNAGNIGGVLTIERSRTGANSPTGNIVSQQFVPGWNLYINYYGLAGSQTGFVTGSSITDYALAYPAGHYLPFTGSAVSWNGGPYCPLYLVSNTPYTNGRVFVDGNIATMPWFILYGQMLYFSSWIGIDTAHLWYNSETFSVNNLGANHTYYPMINQMRQNQVQGYSVSFDSFGNNYNFSYASQNQGLAFRWE